MPNKFTPDELIAATENWLVKGDLNPDVLSENFHFISPFWKSSNKKAFLAKFIDSTEYKEKSLAKILKFDPIIRLKDDAEKHFTIVLQYHTKNQHSVYETVLGTVNNGLITELRSIYDLTETKVALDL